jgi:uncharacterized protein
MTTDDEPDRTAARAASWPLPRVRHVPGTGSTPDRTTLDAIKATIPPRIVSADWPICAAYRYGFRLADTGYFWEAHEIWEPVWLACAAGGIERLALRSLIQLVNAELKMVMRQPTAARRLVGEVRTLIDEIELRRPTRGAVIMGLDLVTLDALAAMLEAATSSPTAETGHSTVPLPLSRALICRDPA